MAAMRRSNRMRMIPELAGVGKRIKTARLAVGLPQRAVVEGTPFTAAYLCRVEQGERAPSRDFLEAVAPKLAASAAYLETGRDLVDLRVERDQVIAAIPTLTGDLLQAAIGAAFPGRSALDAAFAVAAAGACG